MASRRQETARRLEALVNWLRARVVRALTEGHEAAALARSVFEATKKDTETLEREALDRGPFTSTEEGAAIRERTPS